MNRKIIGTSIAALAAVASAVVLMPLFAHAKEASHTGHRPLTAQGLARRQRMAELEERGGKAMEARDYAAAEQAYKTALAEQPQNHVYAMYLTRLYDAQGRDADALKAYDLLYAPSKGSPFPLRDPRPLSRYGDLLAKAGRTREARQAYAIASQIVTGDETPETVSDRSTLAELKSAAHKAAGMRNFFTSNNEGAEKELAIASAANPKGWETTYYKGLAQAMQGKKEEARQAIAAVEARVPPRELSRMRHMRQSLGIAPHATSTVVEIHGKTATVKEVPVDAPKDAGASRRG